MISKDQSIVTQVAAKIAADLIIKTEDTTHNLGQWLIAFDAVNEALQQAHGVSLLNEAFPNSTMETATAPNAVAAPKFQSVSAPQNNGGSVRIAGQQHGDIPNWLIAACQKAGVNKVWDNRDKAVGTKRPWFKQADAVDGAEPVAFWPPKGVAA